MPRRHAQVLQAPISSGDGAALPRRIAPRAWALRRDKKRRGLALDYGGEPVRLHQRAPPTPPVFATAPAAEPRAERERRARPARGCSPQRGGRTARSSCCRKPRGGALGRWRSAAGPPRLSRLVATLGQPGRILGRSVANVHVVVPPCVGLFGTPCRGGESHLSMFERK
ncbi:unnamed protein product [Prorocentrum cordatum]|uniref:Uncharacterized protein n=1 Tax=Prorocentrum cordatum TaxID=2364126 RepID=A0ABN9VD81_9DINO|nr:unnamed protein product [Polarella glacialis]